MASDVRPGRLGLTRPDPTLALASALALAARQQCHAFGIARRSTATSITDIGHFGGHARRAHPGRSGAGRQIAATPRRLAMARSGC